MSSTFAEKKKKELPEKYAGMVPKLNEPEKMRPEEIEQFMRNFNRVAKSADDERKLRALLEKGGYSKELANKLVEMNEYLNKTPGAKGEPISKEDIDMLRKRMDGLIKSAEKERELRDKLTKEGYSQKLIENLVKTRRLYEK